MKRPELLVFGVDGMSFELTRALLRAGRLPHLARLASQAALSRLRCTWPPHTATGWTSFVAGALPGRHGVFQFWDCQDPDYAHRAVERTAIGRPTLLEALAEAGRDIGFVNLPMSHPPSDWPGYEITWPLTPTLRFMRPREIFRELCGVGGHVRSDLMCMYDGGADYPSRARAYVQARTRAMKHLMTTRPTAVTGVVYTEVDRVSHHWWHEWDGAGAGASTVVAEIYEEVDRALGELLALVGDETSVLVVSDHGFGPCSRGLGLHRLLSAGGFCALRDELAPFEDVVADLGAVGHLADSLDWAATRAYMPTPGCFGVNLNLRARQRDGVVPGERYETTRDEVAEYLRGLSDPLDGGPLFSAVVPRESAYPGPFCALAPDLLLVPRDPSILLVADPRAPLWCDARQSGVHALSGVCLLRTRRQAVTPASPGIEALAGLLLDDLGIEAPAIRRYTQAETEAAAAFLPHDAWLASAGRAPANAAAPVPARPTTDDSIEARLRRLGYW
jgi:predicted AlkP superfamily phosphohydrolase/phosphomutase